MNKYDIIMVEKIKELEAEILKLRQDLMACKEARKKENRL